MPTRRGDYFYGTLVQGTDAAQWTSLDGSQTRSIAAEQTVQLDAGCRTWTS